MEADRSMIKMDDGLAFAAIGATLVETVKIYQTNAPSLKELRCAPPGDFEARQLILDADIMGLVVVVALGGSGAMLIRRWYPILLAGMGLLLMSAYYRSVLRSANEGMVRSERREEGEV